MGISAIGSNGAGYDNLSTGKKLNTAADNPSGLIIAEELTAQRNGYDVGSDNAAAGKDLLNVAEGALGNIQDSLQRIRELSVQASNTAVYSAKDIAAMQEEVEQLKQGIQFGAESTEFNTQKLLDGSMADMNLATNPDGTGMKIQMANATLEALGIADFDLTKDFDISAIDDAISKVSEARSSIGATTNALDSTIRYNDYTSQNLTVSKSRLEDLDYGKAMAETEKEKVLFQYRTFAQQEQVNQNNLMKKMFFE